MYVLLVIGIVLVIFGALVLVKLPDKAGGKVSWLGVEISSTGAGLPLIVLGVVTMTLAATLSNDGSPLPQARPSVPEQPASPGQAPSPNDSQAGSAGLRSPDGCFQDYFQGVPLDRVSVVEAGADNRPVIRADQPKSEPLGLQFNDNGAPLGGMRLTFFMTDNIFKIQSVVDAQCQPFDTFLNLDKADQPKMIPLNYSTLRLQFENGSYNLTLDGGETIKIRFVPAA